METALYSLDKAPRIAGPGPRPRAGNPSQTQILSPPPLPWPACDLLTAEACVVPQWWLLSILVSSFRYRLISDHRPVGPGISFFGKCEELATLHIYYHDETLRA